MVSGCYSDFLGCVYQGCHLHGLRGKGRSRGKLGQLQYQGDTAQKLTSLTPALALWNTASARDGTGSLSSDYSAECTQHECKFLLWPGVYCALAVLTMLLTCVCTQICLLFVWIRYTSISDGYVDIHHLQTSLESTLQRLSEHPPQSCHMEQCHFCWG